MGSHWHVGLSGCPRGIWFARPHLPWPILPAMGNHTETATWPAAKMEPHGSSLQRTVQCILRLPTSPNTLRKWQGNDSEIVWAVEASQAQKPPLNNINHQWVILARKTQILSSQNKQNKDGTWDWRTTRWKDGTQMKTGSTRVILNDKLGCPYHQSNSKRVLCVKKKGQERTLYKSKAYGLSAAPQRITQSRTARSQSSVICATMSVIQQCCIWTVVRWNSQRPTPQACQSPQSDQRVPTAEQSENVTTNCTKSTDPNTSDKPAIGYTLLRSSLEDSQIWPRKCMWCWMNKAMATCLFQPLQDTSQ